MFINEFLTQDTGVVSHKFVEYLDKLRGATGQKPRGLKVLLILHVLRGAEETVSQLIFRPFGAWVCPTWLPTACAVGFILAPLRG